MLRKLGAVLIAVREAAAAAVLFVRPQHDTDGAPRPEIQLLHDPQRLPRHHAAAASKCASIFRRTTTRVPRSDMRCRRSASSAVMAAAGIFGASTAYCSAP